jgi:hypothetical protein
VDLINPASAWGVRMGQYCWLWLLKERSGCGHAAGFEIFFCSAAGVAIERFTGQPRRNTQSSDLAIRPQNEENELIFMIYNLRLVILEILRVF